MRVSGIGVGCCYSDEFSYGDGDMYGSGGGCGEGSGNFNSDDGDGAGQGSGGERLNGDGKGDGWAESSPMALFNPSFGNFTAEVTYANIFGTRS